MESIKKFKDKLINSRPEEWEQIPDIELYMDQVILYMKRQHIGLELEDEETLTSAMINNYIKSGLLPRANGKRYSREHIGYLTAICLLKQVLSVGNSDTLMKNALSDMGIEKFYGQYKEMLDMEFKKVAEQIDENSTKEQMTKMALQMAISSYAQKLACEKLLESIPKETEEKQLPRKSQVINSFHSIKYLTMKGVLF